VIDNQKNNTMQFVFWKRATILAMSIFFSLGAFSQGEMLTKGETINYINRVVKRAVGYNAVWIGCGPGKLAEISRASFEASGDDVVYTMDSKAYDKDRCMASSKSYKYVFSPVYIKTVTMKKVEGTSIAYAKISFTNKGLVRFTDKGEKFWSEDVSMYFVLAEPKNFESLKKALFHLKDLASAEEDPFGE